MTKKLKHTAEPWIHLYKGYITTAYGPPGEKQPIARTYQPEHLLISEEEDIANAERIVECINACAGITNPEYFRETIKALELITGTLGYSVPALQNQCRDLLVKLGVR